jgi:hypothetical protein
VPVDERLGWIAKMIQPRHDRLLSILESEHWLLKPSKNPHGKFRSTASMKSLCSAADLPALPLRLLPPAPVAARC